MAFPNSLLNERKSPSEDGMMVVPLAATGESGACKPADACTRRVYLSHRAHVTRLQGPCCGVGISNCQPDAAVVT